MASKEYVRFLLDAPLAEPTETDYQDAAEGLLEEMGHLNALHDARQTSSDDSGWAAMVVDEGEGATDLTPDHRMCTITTHCNKPSGHRGACSRFRGASPTGGPCTHTARCSKHSDHRGDCDRLRGAVRGREVRTRPRAARKTAGPHADVSTPHMSEVERSSDDSSDGDSSGGDSAGDDISGNENPPPVAQINGLDAWTVEAFVKSRRSKKHRTEYLVRWRGYGSESDTWESAAQLTADLGEEAFGILLDAFLNRRV